MSLYVIYFIILAGCSMLFPLERGFPLFGVGPFKVPVFVLLCIAGVFYLLIKNRLQPNVLATGFICFQSLVTLSLLLSCFVSLNPDAFFSSVRLALQYGCTWVLLYIILVTILPLIGLEKFVKIICIIGSLAGAVGLVEAALGQPFGPYFSWAENYLSASLSDNNVAILLQTQSLGLGRIGGTLGNPIIFSSMLIAVLVLAIMHASNGIKIMTVVFVTPAILLAFSRTTILMALTFAVVLVIRSSGKLAHTGFVLLVTLLISSALLFLILPYFPDVQDLWLQRLGFRQGVQRDEAYAGSEARLDLLTLTWEEMEQATPSEWAFGHGAQSSSLLTARYFEKLTTIDNAYATLLYENGLFGLLSFLAAFFCYLKRNTLRSLNVLPLLVAGFVFVFYAYFTLNFAFMALMVADQIKNPVRR
jgi:hypothetical protein